LYVPSIDWSLSGLAEERSQYDITVKLFYSPGVDPSHRDAHTAEALALVMKELKVAAIDLLIVSFPGVTFDGDSEEEKIIHRNGCIGNIKEENRPQILSRIEPEPLESMVDTWRILEDLHAQGLIRKLGVCEFGNRRLRDLLRHTRVRPLVDQINVRDCCVVPRPLIDLAKEEGIELLTHNDCTDILPRGTIRELLGSGEKGAGLLVERDSLKQSPGALVGNIVPQWVVKYTAVVKDRGVVENKGYFAVAKVE
jgi:glutamate--cysteine ligase regulatory subunit